MLKTLNDTTPLFYPTEETSLFLLLPPSLVKPACVRKTPLPL